MSKIDPNVTRFDSETAAEKAARRLCETTGRSYAVVAVGGRQKKRNRAAKPPAFVLRRV